MKDKHNIYKLIEKNLPGELVSIVREVILIATNNSQRVYLVGGVVRDLLLGKPNFDLDFVVEGDAIGMAVDLVKLIGGGLTKHTRFNTAKVKLEKWNVDLATARNESYAHPGALPAVKPGTLKEDLRRRDFTINAMAVQLTPESQYGDLIDPYGGYIDLRHKAIKVLHEKSFIDDATRVWRAIRYEQRLDFHIESKTLQLLERDVAILATISGDRIRHELELILREEYPEKVLQRAWVLKVLGTVHPSLRGDTWLKEKFSTARGASYNEQELSRLYLALLFYRLTDKELEEVIAFLRLGRQTALILRDSHQLKSVSNALSKSVGTEYIYSILHGYHQTALLVNYVAADSIKVRRAIKLYLDKLRYIKTALTGDDLQALGIPQGEQIQEVLILLHNARLNSKVKTRHEEEMLVREWLVNNQNN
jgi:tRNA nucleotidyltransferase (CCA-adding enzyme)